MTSTMNTQAVIGGLPKPAVPPGTEEIEEVIRRRKEEAKQEREAEQKEVEGRFDYARECYPVTDFPDGVLPLNIEISLKQVARAYSANFLPLPGAALAIISSVLGRTVTISAKKSWKEILSLWFVDLGPSGSGKTHAPRALCSLLYEAQEKVDLEYRAKVEEENLKPAKERNKVPRARGYFSTDLTLEGLRADVADPNGHGGQIVIMDELSSFLTGQNQYKGGKGNDREMWLQIYDGKPGRSSRAEDAKFIKGARVSIFGGIQPDVWHKIFGAKGGTSTTDGTIQRFLPTIKGSDFIPVTDENWDDHNRKAWEYTLQNAMKWADKKCSAQGWKPLNIIAEEAAWGRFKDWVNEARLVGRAFPNELQSFVGKAGGHALRLAGAIHCLNRFAEELNPCTILSCQDIESGIRAFEFYMGQMVEAMSILKTGKQSEADKADELARLLAKTLESLRGQTDSGKIAVGVICDLFNISLPNEQKIKPKGMGSLIRRYGLTMNPGRTSYLNRTGVNCFLWNQATEEFLKKMSTMST